MNGRDAVTVGEDHGDYVCGLVAEHSLHRWSYPAPGYSLRHNTWTQDRRFRRQRGYDGQPRARDCGPR